MKKKHLIVLFFTLIISSSLMAKDYFVKDLSCRDEFMIMGVFEMRTEKGFDKPVEFNTFNHENGTKLMVLQIDEYENRDNTKGVWLKVRTTASMWVEKDSGSDWIERFSDFWIFLPLELQIYDFR